MPLFTPPPLAPQRGDRATFSQRVDAFLTWLVALIPQLNIFVASLNARDVGGAKTFIFVNDGASADSDPGPGNMRFSAIPQSNSTVIRLDNQPNNGGEISSFLSSLASGTSNIKGSLRVQKVNDPTAWILFDIFDLTNANGYWNIGGMVRTGSNLNPFSGGDSLVVFFDRNGDKGDGGGTPTQQQIRDAIGVIPLAKGGTGATTASAARTAIGATSASDVILKSQMNVSPNTRLQSGAPPAIQAMNGNQGQEDNVPLIIGNDGNDQASAVIQFLRTGKFAAFFGIDVDNKWKVGGYSMGPNAYELWHQGNFNPSGYAQLSGAAFTGNVSAQKFTATSDESLKENWRAIPDDFLERFAAIERAGLFDWSDSGETDGGIGAQSVREIAPWCVVDVDGKLSVNHAALNTVVSHALARRVLRNEAMQ